MPYHQAALKAVPNHFSYRQFYRNNRWRMTETLLELKDHVAAAVTARQFLEAGSAWFWICACIYNWCGNPVTLPVPRSRS